MIEESAQAERKIRTLDTKLENAKKEIDGYLEEICQYKDTIQEQTIKLDEGEDERKQLHERIQQLKGNIRVFSRVRPLLTTELDKVSSFILDGTVELCLVFLGKLIGAYYVRGCKRQGDWNHEGPIETGL